jgi:hypothetical protein
MEKIKSILSKAKSLIKDFECKYDCINAIIFAGGFFVGSQFTEVFGAVFMLVFWMVGSLIGRKMYKNYKSKD